jgi:WD40 repeat protein
VSGSDDGTIKVWDELPFLASLTNRLTVVCLRTDASSLALVTEKTNAHSRSISSNSFNHDGSQIVSGC